MFRWLVAAANQHPSMSEYNVPAFSSSLAERKKKKLCMLLWTFFHVASNSYLKTLPFLKFRGLYKLAWWIDIQASWLKQSFLNPSFLDYYLPHFIIWSNSCWTSCLHAQCIDLQLYDLLFDKMVTIYYSTLPFTFLSIYFCRISLDMWKYKWSHESNLFTDVAKKRKARWTFYMQLSGSWL